MSANAKIHVLLAEMIAMSKKCGDHEAALIYHNFLKDDPALWSDLDFVGYLEYDEESKLELRNCHRCGSTLAIKISV